jgi:hypothetical protein
VTSKRAAATFSSVRRFARNPNSRRVMGVARSASQQAGRDRGRTCSSRRIRPPGFVTRPSSARPATGSKMMVPYDFRSDVGAFGVARGPYISSRQVMRGA